MVPERKEDFIPVKNRGDQKIIARYINSAYKCFVAVLAFDALPNPGKDDRFLQEIWEKR
jgi:hypothetical protein